MNNRAYVPVRRGEKDDWYDWENAGPCRETVDYNLKAENRECPRMAVIHPVLRIAIVEVHEVQEA
jgi:hypothetical protein